MNIPGRRISKDEIIYTSPFPRGGDGMFLRAQVIAEGGTLTNGTSIEVYTRNTEDSWSGSKIGSALELTGTKVGDVIELHIPPSSVATDGIKEELRLRIKGVTGDGWMTIRIFPPLFYDAAIGTA